MCERARPSPTIPYIRASCCCCFVSVVAEKLFICHIWTAKLCAGRKEGGCKKNKMRESCVENCLCTYALYVHWMSQKFTRKKEPKMEEEIFLLGIEISGLLSTYLQYTYAYIGHMHMKRLIVKMETSTENYFSPWILFACDENGGKWEWNGLESEIKASLGPANGRPGQERARLNRFPPL